jgi:hypothetical protein
MKEERCLMSYKGDYDILREFINESLDTNEVRIDEKIKTAVRAVGGENQFTYKSDWGNSFGGPQGKTGLPQSVEKLPGSIVDFGKSVATLGGAVGDKVKAGHKKLVSGSSRYDSASSTIAGHAGSAKGWVIDQRKAGVNKMTPWVRKLWHTVAGVPLPPDGLPHGPTAPDTFPFTIPGCPPSESEIASYFATLNSTDKKFLRTLDAGQLRDAINAQFGCD